MLYPNRLIYFYFLIPIKAKYFVLIMGIITFFSSFSQGYGGISHLTHLGGIIIGYLYVSRRSLFAGISFRRPHISIKNPFKNFVRKVNKKPKSPDKHIYGAEQTMREELDRLLDKINRTGYESLSESERQNLILIGKYFADKDKMKN